MEGDGVEFCDAFQPLGEAVDELDVALGLGFWAERVHVELGPGEWEHLGGSVEFHCAAAQGDHGFCQGEIFGLEVGEVPHHLGLGVDGVEYCLLQVVVSSE